MASNSSDGGHGDAGLVQFVASLIGAVFEPLFAPGVVDEDLLHGGGGRLEEMPAIGEALAAVPGDLQLGLVDESRGLKSLSGFFIGHPYDGEFAQLLINERKQFIGGFGVAMFDGVEDLSDVAHTDPGPQQIHLGARKPKDKLWGNGQ